MLQSIFINGSNKSHFVCIVYDGKSFWSLTITLYIYYLTSFSNRSVLNIKNNKAQIAL